MGKLKEFVIKKKKVIIPAAIALALAIGSITAYAISTSNRTISPVAETTKETEVESESETETEIISVNVSIELNGVNADHVALPAEVEIILDADAELLDKDSKTVEDMNLALDKATDIAELPAGDYTIHLLATPIEIDGSTYKLPKESVEFEIAENTEEIKADLEDVKDEDDNIIAKKLTKEDYTVSYDAVNGDVLISIDLERLDVDAMSKEQLEAVITRIQAEKPDEHKDLIDDLITKTETAESQPETAGDIAQESNSTGQSETTTNKDNSSSNNSGTDSNSNNNSSSNNNSGSTTGGGNSSNETNTPTETTHTHTWVDHTTQVAREETYIVREWDEQVQVGSTPIYETRYVCPICGHTDTRHAVASHIASAHIDYIRENGSVSPTTTQVQVGETPIYETQHKIEYGTRTVYDTVVDYQYCSGCGQKK